MSLFMLCLRNNTFASRAICAFRSKTHRKYSSEVSEPKPYTSIPGLSSLPLLGPLHHFLPVIGSIGPSGNMIAVTETLHKRFGPIVKLDGVLARAPSVILYEPEHYDQVFKAEEDGPLRPGFDTILYFQEQLQKSISKDVYGLTTAQGPKWRHFRSKVNPAMLKPKIVKLYAPVLKEISEDALKRWTKLYRDSMLNNFDYEVTKWSLESVALICLGDRIGCFDEDITETHPGMQLIKCSKDIMDLCLKLEMLPIPWRYISTPNFKALMKTLHTQWSVSEMYIKQAKRKINERGHDIPEEDKSIIEKLLAIDETVAVLMATEMLMAGIDTVAFSTIGLLYHLAVNQDKQDKLREQIRSGEPNQRYVKACLKETLRIWPVVSANLRRSSKEHVVAGYRIPEGIDVIAPNQYLSNMDKYYIRPNEYIPERWLAEKTDPLYYGKAHPMVTLPFGFGVRSCIGRRIAELEIETLIKTLVSEVKVTWDGPPINIVNRVVNSIKKPFHFQFHKL